MRPRNTSDNKLGDTTIFNNLIAWEEPASGLCLLSSHRRQRPVLLTLGRGQGTCWTLGRPLDMKNYRGTSSCKGLLGWCISAPFDIFLEERGAAPVSESGRGRGNAAAAAAYKRVMSCSTRGLPGNQHVCACQRTDVTSSREVMSRSPFLYCPSRIYLS